MNRSLCSGTQIFDLGDQKILEREVAHSPINTFNMFLYPHNSSCRFLKSMQRSLLLRIVCNENLQQDLFYGLMYSYLHQQDWAKGNVLQSIKTLTLVWGEIKWQRTGTSCSSHRGQCPEQRPCYFFFPDYLRRGRTVLIILSTSFLLHATKVVSILFPRDKSLHFLAFF